MNKELKSYIESEVLPRYDAFDKGHRRDHAEYVIAQALQLASHYSVNPDMVYVAAAFHDTGLCENRETHHIVSAKIIREDRRLVEWFSPGEIDIIADAAEDHRASSDHEPRSIYGKLIAEADRQIIPEVVIRRTIQFGLKNYPDMDQEGHWQRTLDHLHKKYAEGGYLKLWIPESDNAARLEELRSIIRDEKRLRELFEKMYQEENLNMKKNLVVLTGAGVSAESGLGTYRDNGGLWDNYDPMEVASIDGWYRNREKVLDFYNTQRKKLKTAMPNSAHLDIAALEKSFNVTVITQNVDDLHERAGSSHVLHLHGEVTKVRPENGIYEVNCSEDEVIDIGYDTVKLGDKAPNGSQLRPHIVFFGEAVPKIEEAAKIVSHADILLIVGTSLQVYPAAGLYRYARREASIYLIDPADVAIDGSRITHIHKTATEGMKEIRDSFTTFA